MERWWEAKDMVAVRNLLSSLNSLAPGLLANGWSGSGAAAPAEAHVEDGAPEVWQDPYLQGGVEPPLEEVLLDPVVHLMMRADRLEPDEVRQLLTSKQAQSNS